MPTRVYIQSELFPDIKLVEVDDHATIDELKRAVAGFFPPDVDISDLTFSVEDGDEETDKATHVKHLKKPNGVRVHFHRCKHIEVEVRHGAETVHHSFRPATTIGHIRNWAGKEFGMKPADIAEHVLQISGTTEQPDADVHVGSLTKCPDCSVAFDLVPAHRING
ncbi:MAG: hypothetical protein KGL40_05495 [Rhodocyclaceae bacterium]|nr:hypothetical protein [Rhodocyclaceae bacterium]